MKVCYPWQKVSRGEGFFVPSLDTAKTRQEGLVAAIHVRVSPARAIVAIHDGLIGVWFFIPPRQPHETAPRGPSESLLDAAASRPGATETPV